MPENTIEYLVVFHKVCCAMLSDLTIHEFNNVLTGLSGYAQMAARAREPQMVTRSLKALEDGVGRLIDGIRNTLAFTRGSLHETKPFEAHQCASLVTRLLDYHLSRRNVEVTVETLGTALVLGNATLFESAVMALLLDCRDRLMAGGGSGTVRIVHTCENRRFFLEISDSLGCPELEPPPGGAKPDEAQPFDALRWMTPEAVKAVVALHDGTLSVRHDGGRPVRVVELPVFIG
ncbi:MAG: HAMP domain-containing histidine kinase [Acidobacteria bacterium]|nr:HAMP domain-containing histidine kinase [Acidobacteriota bacterium]